MSLDRFFKGLVPECPFEDKKATRKYGKGKWRYCRSARSLLLCDPENCMIRKYEEDKKKKIE